MGLRENQILFSITLLKEQGNDSLVPHSALIREASSCRRWELTRRPTWIMCREREILQHLAFNRMSSSTPPLQAQGEV